jgi:hypothetical protein
MENNMLKYQTVDEYKQMVRNMSAQDLMNMADMYNEFQNPGHQDVEVKNILNAEVERRIYNWEIAQV